MDKQGGNFIELLFDVSTNNALEHDKSFELKKSFDGAIKKLVLQ